MTIKNQSPINNRVGSILAGQAAGTNANRFPIDSLTAKPKTLKERDKEALLTVLKTLADAAPAEIRRAILTFNQDQLVAYCRGLNGGALEQGVETENKIKWAFEIGQNQHNQASLEK